MRFILCHDIVNHRDINVLAFHNDHDMNFIINIYFDSDQTALCFLSQNIINLDNCYRRAVMALSDYPRWIFRKNSMEFFIGLSYYLYYFISGCTLKSCGHKPFQNILWSHDSGHVVCLLKFPHYLYLDPLYVLIL